MRNAFIGVVAIILSMTARAGEVAGPLKVSAEDAKGAAFGVPQAVTKSGKFGTFTNRELLVSKDKKYIAGMFKAADSDMPIESYPDDEFCYFLSGAVTLTSADGTKVELKPGDAVVIPKGWKGRWTTSGYTKYYVIYK